MSDAVGETLWTRVLRPLSRSSFAVNRRDIFTDEDRRKAAAVTNQIRCERAEIIAMELENELLERRVEVARAPRARKAAKQRARRAKLRAQDRSRFGSSAVTGRA